MTPGRQRRPTTAPGGSAPARGASGLAALPLAALTLATSAALPREAGAQTWPIREFQVVNVEPSGLVEGNRGIHRLVEEMVRLIRESDTFDPDFPSIFQTVPLKSETKADIEAALRSGAVMLDSWGFPTPELQPLVTNEAGETAYRVYLVTGRAVFAGIYHSRPCAGGTREPVIVLDGDDILDGDGGLTDFGVATVVHELVHASEQGFPSWDCRTGRPGQWVREGTADAIGWDVARQIRGLQVFRRRTESVWGRRSWTASLPVPGGTGTVRAYRTSSFWRYLGEYAQRAPAFPGPGLVWPVDYSYLPRVLGRPYPSPDCLTEGAACRGELNWLDEGFRSTFGLPLRDLYARFLQDYTLYGENRVHAVSGGSPATVQQMWVDASFREGDASCEAIFLAPDPGSLQQRSIASSFAPVSTRCWEVHLDGFPEGVVLEVAAEGPVSPAQIDQLTAVMADGSGRLDPASVGVSPGSAGPRATWYYDHVASGDSALFLLTNVADVPGATRPLPGLEVTFTALDAGATVALGGSAGDGEGNPGDVPPISNALRWTVPTDRLRFGIQWVRRDQNACGVVLQLPSEDGNLVAFGGQMSMPITPGSYPVEPPHLVEPDAVDVLSVNVWLNCETGRCSEWGDNAIDGLPYRGRLDLEHVTPRHVVGDFDVSAEGEPIRVVGRFLAPLGGPRGLPAGHPCAPAPAPPLARPVAAAPPDRAGSEPAPEPPGPGPEPAPPDSSEAGGDPGSLPGSPGSPSAGPPAEPPPPGAGPGPAPRSEGWEIRTPEERDVRVLGTIRATVDGEPRTWYVVAGSTGGRLYSSAAWFPLPDDRRLITAGGFDTDDPPLETFENDRAAGRVTFGTYTGSVMSLSVPWGELGDAFRVDLADAVPGTALVFMPTASLAPGDAYLASEGYLEVEHVGFPAGSGTVRGRFGGVFRSAGGGAIRVEDGTFEVADVPASAELEGG